MSRDHRVGAPPRRSRWYLRAYLRGVGAVALALVVSFAVLRAHVREMFGTLAPAWCRLGACERGRWLAETSEVVGFDAMAPVVSQFGEFLVTRLASPPLAGFLVGGAVLTAVLRPRDRRGGNAR